MGGGKRMNRAETQRRGGERIGLSAARRLRASLREGKWDRHDLQEAFLIPQIGMFFSIQNTPSARRLSAGRPFPPCQGPELNRKSQRKNCPLLLLPFALAAPRI